MTCIFYFTDLSEFEKGAVKILHYNGTAGIFFSSGSKVFGHVSLSVVKVTSPFV